ncbi:LexA family transcriptional regulator [Rhizobium sp. RU35A]|uniref:LexA family transcriptional regulator n=1 Tax=Rhizobium sp. RU35A TaxID=1907414 RepID=UPI001FCE6BBB|nr:LexA family transcriptional regulator [Rhizobium sp. RU35A]
MTVKSASQKSASPRMVVSFDYEGVISRLLTLKGEASEGDFAAKLGISPNTWTAYKKGRQSFGLHEVAKICDVLGVEPQWLLFGGQAASQALPDLAATDLVRLPRFNARASAGNGLIAVDQMPVGEVSFGREFLRNLGAQPEYCYILEARGDSMWPTIPDGALLIVDASKTEVDDGRIYHFNVMDKVLVKRARWSMDGKLYLTSDNQAAGYPPEVFAADRVHELSVGGRVMFTGHAPMPVR